MNDRKLVTVWGGPAFGVTLVREIFPGETCYPHPSGNGIIVAHPERKPMWCRMEIDAYRQEFIEPIESMCGETKKD